LGGQFAPAPGGQFAPARGGQFSPASGGQFDRFLQNNRFHPILRIFFYYIFYY
jgi:hypothetical protein